MKAKKEKLKLFAYFVVFGTIGIGLLLKWLFKN